MAACITLAGESLKAQKQGAHEALEITHFVLALVPDLDPNSPIDRSAGLPPAEQIVGTWAYTQTGFVDPNRVVYSLMLGSDIGDFDWNWIGLVTAEGTLFAVSTVPVQQKRRNIPPLQMGNNVTRNFMVAFDGAQELTGITVEASTWQHDFTELLRGKEPAIPAGTLSQFWRGDKNWADLAGAVRGVVLTGLSTATATAVAATDTLLAALGKLQAQITSLGNNKLDKTATAAAATKLATARALTIGGTSKSFDGGSNVTWTLAEIGTFPVGSQYVQFAETDGTFSASKSPSTLFGGTWSLKFATDSVFFRTEGGRAAEGRSSGVQEDAFQGHWHDQWGLLASGAGASTPTPGFSNNSTIKSETNNSIRDPQSDRVNGEPRTAAETRPRNRLIRVWERTA